MIVLARKAGNLVIGLISNPLDQKLTTLPGRCLAGR